MATSSHSALLFSLICAMHTCNRPANKFLCTVSSEYYGASLTVPVAKRMLCRHPTVLQGTMLIQAAFEVSEDKNCCSLVGSEMKAFSSPMCSAKGCATEYSRILGYDTAKEKGQEPRSMNQYMAFDDQDNWEFKIDEELNGEDGKMAVAVDSLGNSDAVTSEESVTSEDFVDAKDEASEGGESSDESSDEEFETNEADFDEDGKSNDDEEDFKAADDAASEDLNADKVELDMGNKVLEQEGKPRDAEARAEQAQKDLANANSRVQDLEEQKKKAKACCSVM